MNGYLKIVAAALIWGSVGVIVRAIDLPIPILTLYRVFFASVTIYAYIVLTRQTDILKVGDNIYRLIIMGVLLTINWVSFFYAVKLTTIANATLLTYTAPILVAVLSPYFLKEKIERITIVTLALSVVGAALITWPSSTEIDSKDVAGFLWAGLSALTYTGLVILAKPMTNRANVVAIIFYEEITCTLLLIPSLFAYNAQADLKTVLLLFMLGAVQTALAAGLYLSGLRNVKAQHVGIFTYLDPVTAVILAAVLLNEIPNFTTIVGGLLIVLSGLILVIVKRDHIGPEVVGE
jgi:drug/metabolite transporter (DMT)-like permease